MREASWALVVALATAGEPQKVATSEVIEMLRRGAFDEAEPFVRRLVATHPSAETRYLLGLCLTGLYAYEEAEPHLRAATAERPSEHAWLHTLAKNLQGQGKNREAIDVLDRAIALDGTPEYHFSKAMGALDFGDLGLAEKELRISAGASEPMRFVAAGRIVESREEAFYQLARVLLLRGEQSESETLLQKAVEGRPDHLEARFQLGMAQKRAGKLGEARGSFEAVLRQLPTHHGALYNLYRTLVSLGRQDEAVSRLDHLKSLGEVNDQIQYLLIGAESLEHALKKEEGNAGLRRELIEKRLALGGLLLKVGRADDALEHVLAARRQDPEQGRIYLLLAQAFRRLGRRAEAERAEAHARALARRAR